MLREKITISLKEAMKTKDNVAISTIRLINAAIKQKDIDVARARGDERISDDEVLNLLQSLIKSRRESIEMFQQGARQDLVEKESAEIEIIEKFLPKQLSADETRDAVQKTIAATGATSVKDMGKVMAALKAEYAGQLDMSKVSGIVKEQLTT